MHDLVVRGGRVVTPLGSSDADIAVAGGRIAEVAPEVAGGREEIDARGLIVLPAVIDVHVHFNEPGRTEWEGAATGSRALAAGGGAVFFDMPLNSTPCTIGVEDFDAKRAALEAASIADFGLWGGLLPGRIGDMAAMARSRRRRVQGVHVRLRAARVSAGGRSRRCTRGCARRPASDCRWRCMPRARN